MAYYKKFDGINYHIWSTEDSKAMAQRIAKSLRIDGKKVRVVYGGKSNIHGKDIWNVYVRGYSYEYC